MESLNISQKVEINDKQHYKSNYIPVDNTPFTIIKNAEKDKFFGVIGTSRITEDFDNIEECINEVTEITWDRLVQVIWAINIKMEEINKMVKNQENEQ